MNQKPKNRSLWLLYIILGIIILFQSLMTAINTFHTNKFVFALASVESLFALIFLYPKWLKYGALGLLIIISLATILHFLAKDPQWHLIIYLAALYHVFRNKEQIDKHIN
jgi:uncharacterized membrane protein